MILNLYNKTIIIRIMINVGMLLKLKKLMLKKNRAKINKKTMRFKIRINLMILLKKNNKNSIINMLEIIHNLTNKKYKKLKMKLLKQKKKKIRSF